MSAFLKIKVLGKVSITWGDTSLSYIRNVNTIQNTSIPYSNATGQTFTAGQIFFTSGTSGTSGFLQIRSKNNSSITGNGVFELEVEHYPTDTAANYIQNYEIDSSPTSISFTYNSRPVISDIEVETPYSIPYVFKAIDFTANYSDYDTDMINDIQINGDVTGYTYDDVAYIAGTWVPISHIDAGRLVYNPIIGHTSYYEKLNTWRARDSQGNISVN